MLEPNKKACRLKRGSKEMLMKKTGRSSEGQGLCCPHCSDSKYPCVNMEKAMQVEKRESDFDPGETKKS
jgi:hypothetical protein